MPTPDASQFTQKKKLQAIADRGLVDRSNKSITHLYQYVPTTSGLTDFLPSFSNKFIHATKVTRINFDTAPKWKKNGYIGGGGGSGVFTLNSTNNWTYGLIPPSGAGLPTVTGTLPSVTQIVVTVEGYPSVSRTFTFVTTQNVFASSMISSAFSGSITTITTGPLYATISPVFTVPSSTFTITVTFPTPVTIGGFGISS